MKNVLLFQLVGGRSKAQTTVQLNADAFAVLATFLLALQTDDVPLNKLTLCRPLP